MLLAAAWRPHLRHRRGRTGRFGPGAVVALAALALTVPALAACGGDDAPDATVRVLAAASLTDAFTELAAAFEAEHPGTRVELAFGASSALREQVLEGAPADVFASADGADMAKLVEAGAAIDPVVFATNRLEIAVPNGNPAAVRDLADFAKAELVLGLCAEAVPCGRLARQALDKAGVVATPDTEAANVRALLTQVGSGDLDAGIVYRTDVLAAEGEVEGVPIPAEHNVESELPIAVLTGASDSAPAEAFLAFVRSRAGQARLSEGGFGAP